MSDRLATGTSSLVGGVERRPSRTLRSLLLSIAAVGAALALVPLWVGDSGVLMGVAVLGLAFACYTIGFNVIPHAGNLVDDGVKRQLKKYMSGFAEFVTRLKD